MDLPPPWLWVRCTCWPKVCSWTFWGQKAAQVLPPAPALSATEGSPPHLVGEEAWEQRARPGLVVENRCREPGNRVDGLVLFWRTPGGTWRHVSKESGAEAWGWGWDEQERPWNPAPSLQTGERLLPKAQMPACACTRNQPRLCHRLFYSPDVILRCIRKDVVQ